MIQPLSRRDPRSYSFTIQVHAPSLNIYHRHFPSICRRRTRLSPNRHNDVIIGFKRESLRIACVATRHRHAFRLLKLLPSVHTENARRGWLALSFVLSRCPPRIHESAYPFTSCLEALSINHIQIERVTRKDPRGWRESLATVECRSKYRVSVIRIIRSWPSDFEHRFNINFISNIYPSIPGGSW